MDIGFYHNKLKILSDNISQHKLKINRYAMLRLLVFIVGLILLYFLMKVNSLIALVIFFAFAIAFFLILKIQNRTAKQLNDLKTLSSIYENEINVLKNGSNLFGGGHEFTDGKHAYSSDLDIFGKHSIFESMNRSVTFEGKTKLSEWLSNPDLDRQKLVSKQQAVAEMSGLESFKEKMLIESSIFIKDNSNQSSILNWFEAFDFSFLQLKKYKLVFNLSTLLLLGLIPFSFLYNYIYVILFACIIISISVYFYFFRKVNRLHEKISKHGELFANYSNLVRIISQQSFQTGLLKELSAELDKPDQIASELRKLSKLVEQLDYRLNAYVAFFLNVFFFWDIRKCIQIEHWLTKNKTLVAGWLDPIAEIDALLSLGIYKFNHPGYTFPELTENDTVFFEGKVIGHPLIDMAKRVCNDYQLSGAGKFDIITGSNMAGKTTFLRTVGVNAVLAFAGAPVCAEKLSLSPFRIMTYMRIADSLEYNLSTFHAEIQRIRDILDFSDSKEPNLLLLDELLRGTNSMDRATGSKALIRQLSNSGATGLVSTHDLGLTEIETDLPEMIRNFHFDIVNLENDLDFDYKLKEGINKTTNAAMLLKKIGLNVSG
jgi:hypothetical protein